MDHWTNILQDMYGRSWRGKCWWKSAQDVLILSTDSAQSDATADLITTPSVVQAQRNSHTSRFHFFSPSRLVFLHTILLITSGRKHWNHWSLIPRRYSLRLVVPDMSQAPSQPGFDQCRQSPVFLDGGWTDVDQCSLQLCRLCGAQ